jgi:hypothetical protein
MRRKIDRFPRRIDPFTPNGVTAVHPVGAESGAETRRPIGSAMTETECGIQIDR